MASASRAIFPGSFDPLTNGHTNIIQRSLKIFDEIVVAVLSNPTKATLFSVEERVAMIKEEFSNSPKIKVESFSGLLVDYANQKNINIIIRGLRAVSDYDYEAQMALMNKHLCDGIETFFLMTEARYSYISSSLVRQLGSFNSDVSELVPKAVSKSFLVKFKK